VSNPATFVRSHRARLAVLTLEHLVVDMYGGFLLPLIPVLVLRLEVKLSAMTALTGACYIVVNGIQPLAGWLSPRLRGPTLLLVGPLLAGMVALIGTTSSFWVVACLAMIGHTGIGVFHPDGLMAAQAISGSREHLGVPIFLSGGFFGWSVGALLSAQWVNRWGFDGFWVLALLGAGAVGLLVLAGLHRKDGVAPRRSRDAAGDGDGPHFGLLMALGIGMTSAVTVLFTFLGVDLYARFGSEGVRWAGISLASIGVSGTLGSFLWGYLSARRSPFALIALGQFAAVPLYLLLINVPTGPPLLALSILTGPCLGGAFFPVVATLSRRSRELTPGLRAGLIIGGTWGVASLVMMACGWATDFDVTPRQILLAVPAMLLSTAVLALVAHAVKK